MLRHPTAKRLGGALRALMLASALTGVLGTGLLSQAAMASTQVFEGYDPGDPVGSAARKVWSEFLKFCPVAEDAKLKTVVAGFEKTKDVLSGDQTDYLMRQVSRGLRQQPKLHLLDLRDAIGLQQALIELNNKAGAAKIEKDLSQAEVFVRVEGFRRGLELRLDIRVTKVTGEPACPSYALDPFPVPMDFVGQQIKPLQNIVDPLIKDLFLSSRPGKQNILLSSSIIRGTDPSFTDPNVNLVLRSTFNSAIAKMRKDADVTLRRTQAELPIFNVVQGKPEAPESPQDWTANVILRELGQVYEVRLDFTNTAANPIAETAHIDQNEIPPINFDQYRASAPKPNKAPAATAPVDNKHMSVAMLSADGTASIVLGQPLRKLKDVLTPKENSRSYSFTLNNPAIVEFDVTGEGGQAPRYGVYDANNQGVNLGLVSPSRPGLTRTRLEAGDYTLRVTNSSGAIKRQQPFVIAYRRAFDMLEALLPGNLVGTYGDWYVGTQVRASDGVRVCYAATPAMEVKPDGWRLQKPTLFIAVSADRTDQSVDVVLDRAADYAGAPPEATILSNQGEISIPVITDGPILSSGEPCVKNPNEMCTSELSIYNMNRGSSVALTGTTASGAQAEVRYSLRGYTGAINAITVNCKQPTIAETMIWR